ncbi:MAG TPA: triple tyrosine motif-containing protein, partial [Chryseosolibacter sp.]|nr:triple tyrosine motif-containing protein [Chryseosolibacter sp.]
GERDQIIDYLTGLPDNEIFSLMADAHQNIWVAHEYGFTQISPSLPFRSFSYYAGLEGNMLCAYSYHNNVYVGTSLGLFKLDKDEVFDEVITYVDAEINPKSASAISGQSPLPSDGKQPTAQEETPSKKRGFFNFLRRNRGKEKETGDESAQRKDPSEIETLETEAPPPGKVKRVDKVLRSSQHVFKRVTGITAKITHLVENDGKLVAAGLEGVFEINNLTAKTVLHSPTRYVYASEKQHTIIVSTYNDEIWSLASHEGWQQMNLINSLGDQIDYIFEGAENEWWLCGLDRIYRLQMNQSGIQRLQTIELTNPNFERTVGLYFRNQILFVNADGFYRFEREKNILRKLDSLPKPAQYFALDGHILYRDEHRWNVLGAAEERNNLQLLNLFQNLRHITTDQNPQNLWMISGSNELLKFNGEDITVIPNKFPIFLKSIQNNSVKFADFSHIEIDQRNSAVTFEVVQPDFTNPKSIEFRYFLEGMHLDWSDWSSANNKISFPYLPPGEYHLRVEARNIFGKVSALTPLTFHVNPPYWKEPWFYALEFIVFASLVVLSFRLSTRYRIISRFLSLITIILLIEFIQTVIGSSIISDDTPVVAFLIQFVVAVVVLPVEGYLRNLMLRSLDSSGKFYNFISPGGAAKPGDKKSGKRKVKEPL